MKLQKFSSPFFTKIYTVTDEPLNREERTAETLETRAYHMMNEIIEVVLTDAEFKNAFLKAAAEMASP